MNDVIYLFDAVIYFYFIFKENIWENFIVIVFNSFKRYFLQEKLNYFLCCFFIYLEIVYKFKSQPLKGKLIHVFTYKFNQFHLLGFVFQPLLSLLFYYLILREPYAIEKLIDKGGVIYPYLVDRNLVLLYYFDSYFH